jgi:hypothetical protein
MAAIPDELEEAVDVDDALDELVCEADVEADVDTVDDPPLPVEPSSSPHATTMSPRAEQMPKLTFMYRIAISLFGRVRPLGMTNLAPIIDYAIGLYRVCVDESLEKGKGSSGGSVGA